MRTKLRKPAALLLILSLCLSLLACAGKTDTIELAMVATENSSLDDKTFNSSALEGIRRYAGEHGISYRAYMPESKTHDEYLRQIGLAARDGAKIIVMPGFNFESAVLAAQDKYPDVRFILIDGIPNNGQPGAQRVEHVGGNTYSIFFKEEQAGFLAGYAAVRDGFTRLGFLGGQAFPSVIRFGLGYIQGAEYAAAELGLPEGAVEIKYGYCGNFEATPENQAYAASWFNSGTQVIFACGGAVGLSVMAAAQAGNFVIGVDNDQSGDSEAVLTSAMKMISTCVYDAITASYGGSFPGGQSVYLGVREDCVGLPISSSRFRTFSQEAYTAVYDMLAQDINGLASGIISDDTVPADGLPAAHVTVRITPF